ncbi:MAG: hypothetical protein QM662_04355 [Gordonia sp. (in: high G+C Gram-positive bacteria)]
MIRKRAVIAIVAVMVGVSVVGCSHQTSPATRSAAESAPPCAGMATSEYGLGDAVHRSLSALVSLPTRFSTGAATVTAVAGSDTVTIEIHLCGPGANLDVTKDAATAVAHEIALSATLGGRVERMTVLNPATAQRIAAEPFDVVAFAADAAASTLRGQWQPVVP